MINCFEALTDCGLHDNVGLSFVLIPIGFAFATLIIYPILAYKVFKKLDNNSDKESTT